MFLRHAPITALRRLLLSVLTVTTCGGCASDLPVGVPLSAEEQAYERSLLNYGAVPDNDNGKSALMVDLDKTLALWHAASIDKVDSRQAQLLQDFEQVLQFKVYKNFDVVLEMLLQGDERHRAIAAASLGFSRLREPADAAAAEAFRAKWPPKYPRALPHLMTALDSPDFYLVHNALLGMAQIGDPQTPVPPLLARLKDANEEIRSMAAYALSRTLTPQTADFALGGLLEALNDPYPKVRLNAIAAARRIQHRNTAGTLARLLDEDPYIEIQRNSALALGDIGDPQSCEYLILRLGKLLSENVAGRRRVIADLDARRRHLSLALITSLQRLSGEDFGDNVDDWQEWWQGYHRSA